MVRHALLAATLLLAAGTARADWLDHAWSDAAVAKSGAPAVTLTDAGILLVLPEAVLAEAQAAGVETPDLVQRFVRRYAQHCSDVLDLDRPQHAVKVKLFTLRPVPLEDAGERVLGEVLDALKSTKSKKLPHVDRLFVTDEEARDLVIDYEPDRKASCVRPGEPVS